MPSMPLARNAIVAVPVSSSTRSRGSSSSATRDSLSPQVRSTRLAITCRTPARAARSGSTARSSISFIS